MAKIILMTHQKGGVGKSTITYNVATNLHKEAKIKTCIVDMDNQGSLLSLSLSGISDIEIFPASELDKVINSDYNFIFIDTPPYMSNHLTDLYEKADVIVIPTKAGIFDLFAIKSTIDLISKQGCEDKALIVFNMIKPNTSLTDEIKSALVDYGVTVSQNMLSDLVSFSRSSLTKGVEDNEKAQNQIDALTAEILQMTYS
ncbi:chromosome partitioning protein [Chryseobacterium rhizosphaerae]|uniref:ParA family protein n=1 Tax=Chryseobacterium rhizosphaerae TaxID=395937 RepID=UPI00285F4475|nr:ParA family protein [Chryseobacterium rhizosphaerae]MDR6548513.1 chromosome partitioning protein [Chryseobacterium rhizosphaerae]